MTTDTLVLTAPVERWGLTKELGHAGFTTLAASKVANHKQKVFADFWTQRIGSLWIVLWALDVTMAFIFARRIRYVAALIVLICATALISVSYPAANTTVWGFGTALMLVLTWAFIPRWRSMEYAAHVWQLGYTRNAPVPREIDRIANRFKRRFPSSANTRLEVELFGTDPFLTVKRDVGLFGVEACTIAAWDTGVPEFDELFKR